MDNVGRLLELLKATGWQTGMLATVAGCYLFLVHMEWIPKPPSEWVVAGAWILMFVSGGLAFAPVFEAGHNAIAKRVNQAAKKREREAARDKAKEQFRSDIPFLNGRERLIFGYLLEKRSKTFFAESDAGYAANLLGKGYVVTNLARSQIFDAFNMPMAVPDHIWEVLLEHQDEFPYEPMYTTYYSDIEVEPWRRTD